jgi:t-SNARE complex subunit (syntaxin)
MSGKYSKLPTGEYDENNMKLMFDKRFQEQNKNLDILSDSVKRIGQLSLSISEEITQQNNMLTTLETDMENASEKADTLVKKTKELVKKTGGPKTFCVIVVLVIILMILTLLVIYT